MEYIKLSSKYVTDYASDCTDDYVSDCTSDCTGDYVSDCTGDSLNENFINNMSIDDAIEFEIAIYKSIKKYTKEHLEKMHSHDFHENLIQDIAIQYFELFEDIDVEFDGSDLDYESICDFVKIRADIYFDTISTVPTRSYSQFDRVCTFDSLSRHSLTHQIERLRAIIQPIQRTKEWYEFRYNLITASNLGKLFGSESLYNSLICEKCKPLDYASSLGNCSVDSPMHWGTKYEPLTIMLYEKLYKTRIEDFGCIKHSTYPCIGASPDGINVDPESPLYGRMLEVKNIVNREITGIPSDMYWIQMQIQMETCDLNECDFIETQFKEYSDVEFYQANTPVYQANTPVYQANTPVYQANTPEYQANTPEYQANTPVYQANTPEYQGIVLYFVKKSAKVFTSNIGYNVPHYVFMPLDISLTKESVAQWTAQKKEELKNEYALYTTQYWYLDKMSCVLVQRNRAWFAKSISKIENAWSTIEKERITGWNHRLPKKKQNQCITQCIIKIE